MIADLLRANWLLFGLLNQKAGHEPLLDQLMVVCANDLIVLVPLCLLVLWFALARWSPLRPRRGWSLGERAWLEYDRGLGQRLALLGIVAVGIALALSALLGHLVYEPRPFVSRPSVVHQLVPHVADNAFPSDHEAVAAAVATVLLLYLLLVVPSALRLSITADRNVHVALELRRAFLRELGLVGALAVLGLLVALAVGVARVYAGVHYPGDILAGAACGGVGGLGAVAVRPVAEPVLAPLIRLAERVRLA
jgi:membrane-associated phospholipid phosphatase